MNEAIKVLANDRIRVTSHPKLTLLKETLKPSLRRHGVRLNFLALFLIALLRVKTVNMVEVTAGFRNNARDGSNYKRVQRFFRKLNLDYTVIEKIVVALRGISQPWVLSLDRINWSFDETHFNILTLSIFHQDVAYLVAWQMLDKKGNSNTEERIDLLETFFKIFSDAQVSCLCTDREFVGGLWLSYKLLKPVLSFRARIGSSDKISDGKQYLKASVVFSQLKVGESMVLSDRRWVWGRSVYVGALRLDDGDLLVIIPPDSPQNMISDYAQRWGIETLFGMFKTRGFCLESTHFVHAERLSKLLGLMTLALCWAVKMGSGSINSVLLSLKSMDAGQRVFSVMAVIIFAPLSLI